ncbi:MAG TPA: glycogen debranching N-terminal domain-containing protein [Streptomyces sp.]|uniref:amylo-alpha-1,6-glucosidase n=1 Tax=Streptomyces sp. TaxID=1931 RepID=UPI002D30121F|nr:glycogen debranching N-terminal domain-containing protein [Streptomyces sp.]HZG05567.1 glycogen debranching N-terminal domain-containing protein [Streptomyces sp.]
MSERRLLLHAGSFAVTGTGGDITGVRGTSPDGLFARDTRHLSTWVLTVDGQVPTVLVPAREAEDTAVLTAAGTRDEPSAWTLFRRQALFHGRLVEHLRITANTGHDVTLTVRLDVDADFADQFELRSDHRRYDKPGARRILDELPDGIAFRYHRDDWRASTTVTARPAPRVTTSQDSARTAALVWSVDLPAHGSADITLHVAAEPHGAPAAPPPPPDPATIVHLARAERDAFADVPLPVPAGHDALGRACRQGLADLADLRIPAVGPDGETVRVPAAGVPWFLTLFGRDSLLTSYFALPYRPEQAGATLRALAATQAAVHDPARVAQPGKIVHEIRHGELAHFRQVPYGRYYGSVDSTPLFLVLLHAHAERTADPTLAKQLEPQARAAVTWMFEHGGLNEHGYLTYRADEHGLLNQNWKDSEGAVCFADGTPARGVIAVAEVQGYAYDALRRTAALARDVWDDPAWAAELESSARDLRSRFAARFWMPGQAFPALALDGDGRQVDALASDAGHLLWSGILEPEHGRVTGRRLLEPDFFSGWGIRTLAAGQRPYHPLSYHRGSVWPHDNAVIALGLARYGLHEETAALARALADAAAHHGHRLPEVMAGYPRLRGEGPVPYPHSCSPQAWAAATPLALLTAVGAAAES